jgi:hypothetical protein
MWPGIRLAQQALDYWTDTCQRSVPFLDVMRQRGNNYFERAGVLGVRVPIILTSRADCVRTRLASCAGAALCVHSRRAARAGSGKLAG